MELAFVLTVSILPGADPSRHSTGPHRSSCSGESYGHVPAASIGWTPPVSDPLTGSDFRPVRYGVVQARMASPSISILTWRPIITPPVSMAWL